MIHKTNKNGIKTKPHDNLRETGIKFHLSIRNFMRGVDEG